MSRRLVIPAGQTGTDPCGYDSMVSERTDSNGRVIERVTLDPDRKLRTWNDIALENDCVDEDGAPLVEPFGSEWCVENLIDGLGVCTEESGQNPEPEPVATPVVPVGDLANAIEQATTFDELKAAIAALLNGGQP